MDSDKIYQKRINLAIDYIAAHISEAIPLETMANTAGFSSFHFHRIFYAIIGETPADYVQRLRLELAANYLVKTQRSITRISHECGFSGPPTFARAFRQRYGLSPSQYRAAGDAGVIIAPEPCISIQEKPDGFILDWVNLQRLSEIPIIYLACYERYEIEKIFQVWDRLCRWAMLTKVLPTGVQLSIRNLSSNI